MFVNGTMAKYPTQWRNKVAVGPHASIPKGPPLPQKTFKKQRRANFGPPQRWARVHCTPYCYATDPTDPLESVPMVWLSISGQYSLQVIHASTKLC